jgi:hypothetical protein
LISFELTAEIQREIVRMYLKGAQETAKVAARLDGLACPA